MSVAWLRDLEDRVREASTRMRSLQEENQQLHARVAELEARLEASPEADPAAANWAAERDEVRQRVAGLVEQLEALLATTADDAGAAD